MFERFISFEKPFGEGLVQFVYYLALIYLVWTGLEQLWAWITYFDNDWDDALWGVIKTPFLVVFKILIVRIIAELVISAMRMMGTAKPAAKIDDA